jgi:hypothetical protein
MVLINRCPLGYLTGINSIFCGPAWATSAQHAPAAVRRAHLCLSVTGSAETASAGLASAGFAAFFLLRRGFLSTAGFLAGGSACLQGRGCHPGWAPRPLTAALQARMPASILPASILPRQGRTGCGNAHLTPRAGSRRLRCCVLPAGAPAAGPAARFNAASAAALRGSRLTGSPVVAGGPARTAAFAPVAASPTLLLAALQLSLLRRANSSAMECLHNGLLSAKALQSGTTWFSSREGLYSSTLARKQLQQ